MENINKYTVMFKGKFAYDLNQRLAIAQKVSDEELEVLKDLHVQKLTVFAQMNRLKDPKKLKECAAKVREIEFAMQKNWHFPEDENFHEWYKVPKCTCPKMDNADRRGTKYQIRNQDCPIHGWEI